MSPNRVQPPDGVADEGVARIRARTGVQPVVSVVLGSGLGKALGPDVLQADQEFGYESLPGFPAAGVPGHAGRLVLGHLFDVPAAVFFGRVHFYQGLGMTGATLVPRIARAEHFIVMVGLQGFERRYPAELSGGMRQRVAIARAFVLQPDILLADEAFGHLDEVTAAELRETFLALARECGSTAILITHQLEEAIGVGDRIVVLGRSARLLADIHVAKWEKSEYGVLREAIQSTLQSNQRDGRLDRR